MSEATIHVGGLIDQVQAKTVFETVMHPCRPDRYTSEEEA